MESLVPLQSRSGLMFLRRMMGVPNCNVRTAFRANQVNLRIQLNIWQLRLDLLRYLSIDWYVVVSPIINRFIYFEK